MRPIDADAIKEKFAEILESTYTDDYAKGYVNGLRAALNMPTLTPLNEPLSIEQLREMDGPVWVACNPIEGGNGYWCLCQRGHIITPAGSIFDVKEIPHWVFYRRPPEGETNGK